MVSAFIKYKQSDINYLYFGKGPVAIVCFHGYGQDASTFNFLNEYLSNEYFVIAIDFPFHGTTLWNEERAFTKADLVIILEKIFNAHGIKERTFIMMGYSMGGRIALSLMQHIPQNISRLILLAPDGMKVNFWYWLVTQTQIGNRLFRFIMDKPKFFLLLLRVSARFKLINKSVFWFIKSYLSDEDARKQLFHRWTCMRTFKPDLKKMRFIIQQKQLPVRMLYGQHDRIILPKKADKFRKGLESLCQVHIIDSGHDVLQNKNALIITKLLTT